MIREGKYIHIRSVEEASTVIEYYSQFGIVTRGLTLDNCLNFPYLGLYADECDTIVSGWGGQPADNVVSFEEWLESTYGVTEQPDDIDIDRILCELFEGL